MAVPTDAAPPLPENAPAAAATESETPAPAPAEDPVVDEMRKDAAQQAAPPAPADPVPGQGDDKLDASGVEAPAEAESAVCRDAMRVDRAHAASR